MLPPRLATQGTFQHDSIVCDGKTDLYRINDHFPQEECYSIMELVTYLSRVADGTSEVLILR